MTALIVTISSAAGKGLQLTKCPAVWDFHRFSMESLIQTSWEYSTFLWKNAKQFQNHFGFLVDDFPKLEYTQTHRQNWWKDILKPPESILCLLRNVKQFLKLLWFCSGRMSLGILENCHVYFGQKWTNCLAVRNCYRISMEWLLQTPWKFSIFSNQNFR